MSERLGKDGVLCMLIDIERRGRGLARRDEGGGKKDGQTKIIKPLMLRMRNPAKIGG